MAERERSSKNWSDKDTEILKEFIHSKEPFTLEQIQERIDMKQGTIIKHLSKLASEMHITIRNISARKNVPMKVEWDVKPKQLKQSMSAEKFMCKCKYLWDGEMDTVWIAMMARSREEAVDWIMKDYPGIEEVARVYSRMEYAKVRLDRHGRITARYGLGGNGVGHYVSKGGRKG